MPTAKNIGTKFGFLAGFLAGLAAPSYIYATPRYADARSDLLDMRADWDRIGDDFRAVMKRANAEAASEP